MIQCEMGVVYARVEAGGTQVGLGQGQKRGHRTGTGWMQ